MTVIAWQDVVRRKREEQEGLVAAFMSDICADDDTAKAITDLDSIEDLMHAYSKSQLKATDVVKAYACRLVKAHEKVLHSIRLC